MQRIVISNYEEGFNLSLEASKKYLELCGKECYFYLYDYIRNIFNRVEYDRVKNRPHWDYYISSQDEGRCPHKLNFLFNEKSIKRNDENLIKVIEELDREQAAFFKIIEIPEGIEWEIEYNESSEYVSEKHRTWGKEGSV